MKSILILCFALLYLGNAYSQPWRSIKIEAELYETKIGILDPLFLSFSFENVSNELIENINYFTYGLNISFKSIKGEKWEELEYFRKLFPDDAPFKFNFIPKAKTNKYYHPFFPRLSKNTFSLIKNVNPKHINGYENASDKSFKPGKYLFRLTYFPYEIEKDSLFTKDGLYKCEKCIERIIPFEVLEKYEKPENIAAYSWLKDKEEPNLCYKIDGRNFRHRTYSKEEAITYLTKFIELFPMSKFSPYAAFKLGQLYYPKGKDNKKERIVKFSKILELMQFSKENTENPYLINRIGSLRKLENKILTLEYSLNQER